MRPASLAGMKSLAVALALFALACSSGTSSPSASEQCYGSQGDVCAHLCECEPHHDPACVGNCKTGFAGALDCSRMTAVTGHPDVCIAEYRATTCAFWVDPDGLPLPASCKNLYR